MPGSAAFAWISARSGIVGRDEAAARLADLIRTHGVVAVIGPLGIGKTELVRCVVERETAAGRVPPAAYVSLAGVDGVRGILERTCRALSRGYCPVESSRLVAALSALLTSTPCTLVWDDAQDAVPDALAATLPIASADAAKASARIVLAGRDPVDPDRIPLRAWAGENGVASFEVPPLDPAACRQLIDALERRRERTLQDEAILASCGNPLALQLTIAAAFSTRGDPMAGLSHAIDGLPPDARAILFLLLAAGTPLSDADLHGVCGSSASEALVVLARHALVTREADSVSLRPPMIAPVRSLVGPPQAATWAILETLARRALGRAPGDGDALLLECRSLVHRGRAQDALAVLREHRSARASASPAALERVFGEIARSDPAASGDALLALAREQLRWGDFEAARRTLDGLATVDLPPPLAYRRCILSAEALLRAGEPESAAQELERARLVMPPGAEIALAEGLADLAILRGDLHGARRSLVRLARRTRSIPNLEGRRALSLAFSYLLEERHDRALTWARKARQAYRRRGDAAVDVLVPVVEIAALMGLDRIDQATQVAGREAAFRTSLDERGFGQATTILFQGGVLYRRGELRAAMRVGEPAFHALDRRADRIFRARVALYLARSAIGLAQFERAEELIRIAAGIAAEPGLAVLRPMCEMDFTLLCEARGERKEAVEHSRRALSGGWRSPFAQIEAWALDDAGMPPPGAGFEAAQAYMALRSSERALERGELQKADAAARSAETWYRRAGALYELARAHLARGEACARLGHSDECSSSLASCIFLSEKNGYLALLVCAHLVRAFLAERAGDVEGCKTELASAWKQASRELRDESLLRACSRARVALADGASQAAHPFASRIARLGLDRPAWFVVEERERRWILDAGEEPPARFDLIVLLDSGRVRSNGAELTLPPQRLQILERLARSGAGGISLEELHLNVWGGREYHPLRHRNAMYVALTRLRESLRAMLENDAFIEGADGRYRISSSLRVAIRSAWMASESSSHPRAASAE